MHRALLPLIFAAACTVHDVPTDAFGSSSSGSSTGSDAPADEPLEDRSGCTVRVMCAEDASAFCVCAACEQTINAFGLTVYRGDPACIPSPGSVTGSWPGSGGSCGAGQSPATCRRLIPGTGAIDWAHPPRQPISCSVGFDLVCPAGYFPAPLYPGDDPCGEFSCGDDECAGSGKCGTFGCSPC